MVEPIRPEEEGIPSRSIIAFLDRLEKYRVNMHGFSLTAGSHLLAEGYWKPFRRRGQHRLYSVGKSLVSLAIGLLEGEGKIRLDDRICSFFPECLPPQVHPYIEAMTIEDMLTMRTAHSQTTYKRYDGDWVESFFHMEPTNHPGSFFSYDTSSSHVLSALVEKLTGMRLLDFLKVRALDKIGLSPEARILPDPQGVSQGGSGLIATMEDLRNIGLLCLNGGTWEGEQLIPAAYLERALSFQADTSFLDNYDERWGYGFQFWKTRCNGFALYGMGGQLILAHPDTGIMLTTIADTREDSYGTAAIHSAFWDIILPDPGKEKLPADDGAYGELQDRLSNLSVFVPPFPEHRIGELDKLKGDWIFDGPAPFARSDRLSLLRRDSLMIMEIPGNCRLRFGINRPAEGTIFVEEAGEDLPCYGYVSLQEDGVFRFTLKIAGAVLGEIRFLMALHGRNFSLRIRSYGDEELEKLTGIYNGKTI